MAFGRKLDAEDSKDIHEKLKDPKVTSIRFIDTGERGYNHTHAEFFYADGTSFVLTRRHKRFREVFEVISELDLPDYYHDTFFVDLVMPRAFTVEAEVEVTAHLTVTAYEEAEARELFENAGAGELSLDWDFASFRVTNVKADEE